MRNEFGGFMGEEEFGLDSFDDAQTIESQGQEPSLEKMLDFIAYLRGLSPEEIEAMDSYNFFPFPEQRDEIFLYSSEITRYLHDKKFADVVIVDRSARPIYIGIIECWKKYYPGEQRPGIFFVNPKGFKATAEMSFDELIRTDMESYAKGDRSNDFNLDREREDIDQEFSQVYKQLMDDKDKPIMIFDTCIHSGKSIMPIRQSLSRLGFSNVEIGSINPAPERSMVDTDYHITSKEPSFKCYPFDKDRLIEKTFEHVYSSPSEDIDKKNTSRLLRKEIQRIIKEKLATTDIEKIKRPTTFFSRFFFEEIGTSKKNRN